MKEQLLAVIMGGLRANPTQASADLKALGVRSGALDELKRIDAQDVEAVAERIVMQLDVNYEKLARIDTPDELLPMYLQHGATNELIAELLGFSTRQIAAHRKSMGYTAQNGRPAALDAMSADNAGSAWQALAYLPKAARLLAVHGRMPMWALSSLYAALRNK